MHFGREDHYQTTNEIGLAKRICKTLQNTCSSCIFMKDHERSSFCVLVLVRFENPALKTTLSV